MIASHVQTFVCTIQSVQVCAVVDMGIILSIYSVSYCGLAAQGICR